MNKNWQKFESFLKREGVFEKYLNNFYNAQDGESFKYDIPSGYLFAAFDWAATDEGFDFWQRINIKWMAEDRMNKPK